MKSLKTYKKKSTNIIPVKRSMFSKKPISCDGTVPSPARFHSLTTWNCEKGAEWVECGAIQFHDFVMVNNEETGIETKFVIGTEYGYEHGAMIKGALIVGHSSISKNPKLETERGVVSWIFYYLLFRNFFIKIFLFLCCN